MPSAESATTDDVDALIGTVLGERYKITRVVGEGGMGRVYEARHLLIGRRVAIKVLKHDIQRHAGFEERLIHEGQLAGTLQRLSVTWNAEAAV